MASTLEEVLDRRETAAARNVQRAVIRLGEGDSESLRDQLEVEDALDEMQRYHRLRTELAEVAADLETFGSRSRHDLLHDMTRANAGDMSARQRLDAHRRTYRADEFASLEMRDIGGSLTQLPYWLTTSPAPTSIPSAPLMQYAQPMTLHAGNTIDLVGFGTNPSAGQSGANASISAVDFTDDTASLPIATLASSVIVPVQWLEQGRRGIDAQVLPRMSDAVTAACDLSILSGDGTGGNVTGLLNTSGIATQVYNDTTPTITEWLTNVETMVRKVDASRSPLPLVIVSAARMSWIREHSMTSATPVPIQWSDAKVPGAAVSLNGTLQILVDPSMPVDLGTGTDEDRVIVARGVDVLSDMFASPHLVSIDWNSGSAAMKARITVRKYLAFGVRFAEGLGVMSGTGLALS